MPSVSNPFFTLERRYKYFLNRIYIMEAAKSTKTIHSAEMQNLINMRSAFESRANTATWFCLGSFATFVGTGNLTKVDLQHTTAAATVTLCILTYVVSLATLLRNSNKASKLSFEISSLERKE